MVLIVRLPARKRANDATDQAAKVALNTATEEQSGPPDLDRADGSLPTPVSPDAVSSAPSAALQERAAAASTDRPAPHPSEEEAKPALPSTPRAQAVPISELAEPTSTAPAASVDVLLAPSVLRHRYVRGVDKSLIVERPERVRAVLLGISGAHGMHTKLSASQPAAPSDLAAQMAGMSLDQADTPIRMVTATRTMSLDSPPPALMRVHAHPQDPTSYELQTEYAPEPGSSTAKTHLARTSYIAQHAPSHPPGAIKSQATKMEALSDVSSSDGEGDERLHACEIPDSLPRGDLYLCGPHDTGAQDISDGGSREAICHALGACAEAVDRVVAGAQATPEACDSVLIPPLSAAAAALGDENSPLSVQRHLPSRRAFVLARPPGHHCNGADPSGFCWVNNVAVAAAHAYDQHTIDRVVILDIDLHHGNGTQSLAWRLNAEAVEHDVQRHGRLASALRSERSGSAAARAAARAAEAARSPWEQYLHEEKLAGPRAQRIFYGSLHDIESYPCETGDADLVRNASVCLAGAHGQWIMNVHLDRHKDDAEFAELYRTKYSQLFAQARRFLQETKSHPQRTLVFISCGFDACTHEYPGMQRHGKHVPPQFYATFARDAAAMADEFADGKLVSVLEGGYSDRALCSGAMAHVGALAQLPWATQTWTRTHAPWSIENLGYLEKMSKRVGAQASEVAVTASVSRRRATAYPAWVVHASEHFAAFQRACGAPARPLLMPGLGGASSERQAPLVVPDVDLATPLRPTTGGHALRDRSTRRVRAPPAEPTPSRARPRAKPKGGLKREPVSPPTDLGPDDVDDAAALVPGALPSEPVSAASSPTPAKTTSQAAADDTSSASLLTMLGQLQLQDRTDA